MKTEECMTIIQTHHITESNFWGTMQHLAERDLPMKVKKLDKCKEVALCGACKKLQGKFMAYCSDCGQKLDWSEMEAGE